MPAQLYDHDHENEVTLFAETNFRNLRKKFGIRTDDRRRHVYIIGKTGMGKTTLIENMVLSDINAGHGVAYIDPHGDTAQKLLDYIPPHRINDVVYLNPADMDFPVGFNILESIDPDKKHLVAAGLMGVFKKIWPDVWSARMEYILLNTILALLDAPGSTLLGINRLLVDEEYRRHVVSLIQDPVVKTFWVKEFASFSEKYRTEAIAPVQNKVGQFLSASIIRNIVAQVKSTIDIRQIMDQRKILILNLAKGLIGEENSRLLGGMIVTRLQLAAMERVDMPEKDRQDFYLYVDEFQNFATTSFANILSEARKYRLNLIVAHQYIEQLTSKGDTDIRDAIFGNVGTIVAFRVGAADAEFMETEFAPQFTPEDLVNLGKYDIYLKLMIDGASSEPFSATTLPPIAQRTSSTEKVIKVSRERYATPRGKIEEKVLRWSGMGTADEGATIDILDAEVEETEMAEKTKGLQASSPQIPEPVKAGKKDKPAFEIPCTVCGKMQKLSFEPDWTRPWYCKECLEKRSLEAAQAPRPVARDLRPKTEDQRRETGGQRPEIRDGRRDLSSGLSPAASVKNEAARKEVAKPIVIMVPAKPAAGSGKPAGQKPVFPKPVQRPAVLPPKPVAVAKPAVLSSKPAPAASIVPLETKAVSLSSVFGRPLPTSTEPEIIEEEGDEEEGKIVSEPEFEPRAESGVGLVSVDAVRDTNRKPQARPNATAFGGQARPNATAFGGGAGSREKTTRPPVPLPRAKEDKPAASASPSAPSTPSAPPASRSHYHPPAAGPAPKSAAPSASLVPPSPDPDLRKKSADLGPLPISPGDVVKFE